MIEAIRTELRALSDDVARLDRTLGESLPLPDLAAAEGLVELHKLRAKLDKAAARLSAAASPMPKAD